MARGRQLRRAATTFLSRNEESYEDTCRSDSSADYRNLIADCTFFRASQAFSCRAKHGSRHPVDREESEEFRSLQRPRPGAFATCTRDLGREALYRSGRQIEEVVRHFSRQLRWRENSGLATAGETRVRGGARSS